MAAPDPSAAAVDVHLTLEEMAFGCERTVEFDALGDCVNCEGTGRDEGAVCAYCDGSGTMLATRTLTIRLPGGLSDGDRVRAQRRGRPGGIVAAIHERHHPVFKRDGLDLRTTVRVEALLFARGGALDVETLDGEVLVKITPEMRPGTVLRVRGQGMPARDEPDRRGNLLVTLEAERPVTVQQRESRKSQSRSVFAGLALILVGIAILIGGAVWRADQTVCESSATVRCLQGGEDVSVQAQETDQNMVMLVMMTPGIMAASWGVAITSRAYRNLRESEPPAQTGSE
jgi:DnaJ-class molecular chaperone